MSQKRNIIFTILLSAIVFFVLYKVSWNNDQLVSGYVTDKNRHFVGKKYSAKAIPEVFKLSDFNNKGNTDSNTKRELPQNDIVKSIENDFIIPSIINEFKTKDSQKKNEYKLDEIIILNGDFNLLINEEGACWKLKKDDKVTINFEKAVSEIPEQSIIVGYVENGKAISGPSYKELSGKHEMNIIEDGEYAFYIINASSDPVTLKAAIEIN